MSVDFSDSVEQRRRNQRYEGEEGRRGGEVGKEGEGREGDGKNTIENIPCSSQSTA